MLAATLFVLTLAQEPPPRPQLAPGTVTGVVRGDDQGSRVLLPHAVVEWRGGNQRRTVADGMAMYRLEGLLPGRGEIRVTRVGFEPLVLEVHVPPGGSVSLDLELRSAPLPLEPVTVLVDPARPPATGDPEDARGAPPGAARVGMGAADAVSGLAEAGLAAAAGRVSGSPGDPEEPGDMLFMRGSATEQKLVLLDGVPVAAPFHVAGLIQGFDPETLGGAELHVGGAPARFDGGLAYILALRTRAPGRDAWRSTGALDLLSARATVEGPLGGRGGLLLGSRMLHGAPGVLPGRSTTPYGYGDALLRLELEPREGQSLRATGFMNQESVALDLEATTAPADLSLARGGVPEAAEWGNQVASAAWTRIQGGHFTELQVGWSRYEAGLPIRGEHLTLAEGSTERARLGVETAHDLGESRVGYGLSLDRTRVGLTARRLDPDEPVTLEEAGSALVAGGYVEGSRALGTEFHLRGGLRVDHFQGNGMRVAPRAALTWLPSSDVTLTLAGGGYHQLVRFDEAPGGILLPQRSLGGAGPTAPLFRVLGASHVVLSLENQVTPGVRLGLDGYVKSFSGLEADPGTPLRSSGLDVRAQREGDRIRGWLGYSLSWLWSEEGSGSGGEARAFTGRHLLTAGVTGELGNRGGVEFRISFGDGLPLLGIPVGEAASPEVDGPVVSVGEPRDVGGTPLLGGAEQQFLRLDGVIHGRMSPRVGGRTLDLRPYLKLINALDRRDALFYYFEPWQEGLRPVSEMALLPVLGLEWRF